MKQEDKELLLKDLSARIYYGVIVHVESHDGGADHSFDNHLIGVQRAYAIVPRKDGIVTHFPIFLGANVKPYLRPLTSMTDEEREEYRKFSYYGAAGYRDNDFKEMVAVPSYEKIDWLNAHHFDYRGLIERGLAIKVTPDNNPYE